MTNVLVPTDLTVASLYPVHEIGRQATGRPCSIYLIHTLSMPTGIGDLLFHQQRKPYDKVPVAFREAIELLRKKYAAVIRVISFEFLYSDSRGYLQNYMQSRSVAAIYLLKDHSYTPFLPQSTDCIPGLLKSRVPVMPVEGAPVQGFGTLTTLLYKEKIPV